jgi:uncharacterized protein YggT (Ycf19 family)
MASSRDNSQTENQIETPPGLKISRFLAGFMYAWTIFGVMMLTLRVFLLAAGATLGNNFSQFVMDVSRTYLQPFRGMFPQDQIGDNNYLDVSAIFAAIIYLFLGWGFHALVSYIQRKVDENLADQRDQRDRAERAQAAQASAKRSLPRSK